MITLKHAAENIAPVLSVAAMMLYGNTALALEVLPKSPQTRTHQPNVNANASTPASRNSISNVRSTIGPGCLIS